MISNQAGHWFAGLRQDYLVALQYLFDEGGEFSLGLRDVADDHMDHDNISLVWSGLVRMASTLARALQMLIQMPQAGELPGEPGRAWRARRAARAEIAAAGEGRLRDHGGAPRAGFVNALPPGQLLVHPEIEPHRLHLTTAAAVAGARPSHLRSNRSLTVAALIGAATVRERLSDG